MIEGLRLWLRGGRRGEGSLSFGRARGFRQEGDLVRDAAAKVAKGLADVRRVVIGFIAVLFAAGGQSTSQQWRVNRT